MMDSAQKMGGRNYSILKNRLTMWFKRRTLNNGIRRIATIDGAIATDVGRMRKDNQDRVGAAKFQDRNGRNFAIVVVADGIGGMRGGAECAATTIGSLIAEIIYASQDANDDPKEWLYQSARIANDSVYSQFYGQGGSTIAAVLIGESQVNWLSVGDSRLYLAQGKTLTQLSVDDTIAGQLHNISEVGVDHSQLLQYIGYGNNLEPHIEGVQVKESDRIIITSDGVHFLPNFADSLGHLVAYTSDLGELASRFLQLANWYGGPDNASIAIVNCVPSKIPEPTLFPSCIEVWDPFGEIFLVMPEEVQNEIHLPEKDIIKQSPVNEKQLDQDTHHYENNNERFITPPKKRKKRRSNDKDRSASSSRDKREKPQDKDAPQLFVEFPPPIE